MNLVLFGHQFRVLLRRGRLIGLALLAIVPAVVVLVVGLVESPGVGLVEDAVAGIGGTTFPIAALILAAATLRDERDAGTLPYIYLKPISRLTLAVTSIAAASAATAVLGLAAGLSLVGATLIVGDGVAAAAASVPLFLAAAVGYSALFVPLGYLLPRIVLIGLGYVILWEQVLSNLITGVANTSLWRFALSIYADMVEPVDFLETALGPVSPGAWGGVAKIGVVVVLGIGLLTWALRRRNAV